MRAPREESGQASVELVALLPLLVVVVLALWQVVLAGQALWGSAGAARAAARAQAVGGDAERAARSALPGALHRGLAVEAAGEGVRVAVGVPLVIGGMRVATVEARAALPPQG